MVEKVYSSLRTHAAERGQQLEVVVPEDLYVLADPQALGQILTNLIENALKYSTSGSTEEELSLLEGKSTVRLPRVARAGLLN